MRIYRAMPLLAPLLLVTACGGGSEQSGAAQVGSSAFATRSLVTTQEGALWAANFGYYPFVSLDSQGIPQFNYDAPVEYLWCITAVSYADAVAQVDPLIQAAVTEDTIYIFVNNISSVGSCTEKIPSSPPPNSGGTESKWKSQLNELLKTTNLPPELQTSVNKVLEEIKKYEASGQEKQAEVLRKLLVVKLLEYNRNPDRAPPVLTVPDNLINPPSKRPPGSGFGSGVRG